MKPVREAAIEALNLIKEIDPSVAEDSQAQESMNKSRTGRVTQSAKPWKKKKNKPKEDDSSPFINYSNNEEDQVEKKISNATKKRIEAQNAKKKARPSKKPNLKKEKKSIFEQK